MADTKAPLDAHVESMGEILAKVDESIAHLAQHVPIVETPPDRPQPPRSYRFRFLKPADPYYANWVDVRQRTLVSWLSILVFVLWPFIAGGLEVGIAWAFGTAVSLFWTAIFPMIVFVILRFWMAYWPCPRCGNPYYTTWYCYWPFAFHCLHCGLPEYAPKDE